MSDILIVRTTAPLHQETMNHLHKNILKQKKSGVVVLPSCCELLVVPDDIEIKLEGDSNE